MQVSLLDTRAGFRRAAVGQQTETASSAPATAVSRGEEAGRQTVTGSTKPNHGEIKNILLLCLSGGVFSHSSAAVYPRLADGQCVTPHDGGPSTGDLATGRDHNHRQGAGLDRREEGKHLVNSPDTTFP